jgi:hypothetical protein
MGYCEEITKMALDAGFKLSSASDVLGKTNEALCMSDVMRRASITNDTYYRMETSYRRQVASTRI